MLSLFEHTPSLLIYSALHFDHSEIFLRLHIVVSGLLLELDVTSALSLYKILIKAQGRLDNSWAEIAKHLPGRSGGDVRSHCIREVRKHRMREERK